jgi:hypothetical protein
MSAHEFPNEAERCTHCSTLRANVNQTACPGPQRHDAIPLRPEPIRREYASEDYDTIGSRAAELYAERTAAMNEPAKG